MCETRVCIKCGIEKNAPEDFHTKNVCTKCRRASDKIHRQTIEYREKRSERRQTPEYKLYMKEYGKRPGRKAYMKAYNQTFERKESGRVYRERPESRERMRVYNQNPEVKARKRAHEQTPRYKDIKKARGKSSAYKESRKTPEYRAYAKEYAKEYRRRPDALKRRSELIGTQKHKAYMSEYGKKFGRGHYRRAERRGNHAERFRRTDIFKRDKFTCEYCQKKLKPEECVLEHRIPIAKGGSHTPENCTTSCSPCNSRKHDKLINGLQITIFDNIVS